MNFKQKLLRFFNKLTFPTFVGGLVLVTVISGLVVLILQKPSIQEKEKITASTLSNDLIPANLTIPVGAKLAPRLKFASYDLQTSLPIFPQELPIYQLENNLSTEKRTQIAERINLTTTKPITDSSETAFVNQEDINSLGYLIIDQDGSFEFKSFGVHKGVVVEGADATKIAQTFLQDLGLWEENFQVTTTYQKEGLSDLTFVEVHRVVPQLPILNPLGLVAVSPEISLDSLQAGTVTSRLPADPSIINSSDGKNGIARPNDFNTITVVVADDGRVIQANSNLRLSKASYLTSDLGLKLKTPQQAFDELKREQAIFGITLPIGEGVPNLESAYPNNEARSDSATITDFVLAYLEKSPNNQQEFLQPVYVFRGTASLATGPTVQWSQIVPAIEKATPLTVLDKMNALQNACIKFVSTALAQTEDSNRVYFPGLGYAKPCWSEGMDPSHSHSHTYCFESTTSAGEQASREEIRSAFFGKIAEQYTINVARRLLKDSALLNKASQAASVEEIYTIFNELNYVPPEPPASGECYQRKDKEGNQIYTIPGDVAPLFRNQWWAFHFSYNILRGICIPRNFTIGSTVPDWVPFPEDIDIIPLQVAGNLLQVFPPGITPTQTPTSTPTLQPTSTPTSTPTTIPVSTPTPTPEIFEPLATETALDNLQNWADQPNLFPSVTLRGFFDTLYATESSRKQFGEHYISGESPAIFVYNPPSSQTKINLPTSKVTYLEPLYNDRLYYEYDSNQVNFSEPKEGFVVEREKVLLLVEELAVKMELNEKETLVLLADVRRVISKISPVTPYVKISLVNQEEINQQLPLSISPQPNFLTRIHLLLAPLQEKISSPQPFLPIVNRSDGFYVVEMGARLIGG